MSSVKKKINKQAFQKCVNRYWPFLDIYFRKNPFQVSNLKATQLKILFFMQRNIENFKMAISPIIKQVNFLIEYTSVPHYHVCKKLAC